MSDLFVPLFSSLAYRKELWALTPDKLTDVSAGPVSYIDSNLELKTIPARSPLLVNGKFWQMGSWKEYCTNTLNPSSWTSYSGLVASTGVVVGSTHECRITDNGNNWSGRIIYDSSLNGSPTKTQYGCLLYKLGTSGQGRLTFYDSGAYLTSYAYNTTGVFVTDTSTSTAGTLTIISDMPIGISDMRIVLFSIDWINKENRLRIITGPNSTASQNILVYGASINDVGNIWPLFNSTGGTTILSRAGTSYCDLTAAVNAKLKKDLYGTDGTNAVAKITFDWQPYYASADATTAQTIFKTGSKTIAFDAISGNITLNDGTTTTSIALTSWASKDTIKFKMLWGNNHPDYTGVNKMQICASKDGGATWINSSVVDFDGSMINPGDTNFYCGGTSLPWAVSNVKAWTLKSGDWPT